MRDAPVGFAFDTPDEVVVTWAERSAAVTHDHAEGIPGAQATATAIFLARHGRDRAGIKRASESQFGYDLGARLHAIRPTYRFTELCRRTVPQALIAFLESTDSEDAVRNAISIGGDADTLACIAGGVAEVYYGGVPDDLAARARTLLDRRLLDVVDRFRARSARPYSAHTFRARKKGGRPDRSLCPPSTDRNCLCRGGESNPYTLAGCGF